MRLKEFLFEITAKVQKWNHSDFAKAINAAEKKGDKKAMQKIAKDLDATTNLKPDEKMNLQSMVHRISMSM